MVLSLLAVLCLPAAVASAAESAVTLEVTSGYSFTAPSGISLGSEQAGNTATGNSTTAGSLQGNNPGGYTVTGVDEKGTDTGYMYSSTAIAALANPLLIGDATSPTNPAYTAFTFVDTTDITDESFTLYVSQQIALDDAVADDYTITITYTVTEK